MEAISLAIIFTVLSLGSVLVYLFRSDYERRLGAKQSPPVQQASPTANNSNKKANKVQNAAKPATQTAKQLPKSIEPKGHTEGFSGDKLSASKSNGHNVSGNGGNNSKQSVGKQQTTNQAAKAAKRRETVHTEPTKSVQLELAAQETRGMEPSLDELDSSVLLGVFNPTNSKPQVKISAQNPKNGHLASNTQQQQSEKKAHRKRQASERSNYSSEQLFGLIAASNLTKDEIELAVETLLNKIESGESDWKQPKSDPLQRVKNQLRDSELALSTEVQNHEQTRARLQELRNELLSERSSANKAKDELARLKKEFGLVSLALEQARSDLNKQQRIQKQWKEESSQVISKLEQDNVQLQNMLASTSVNENEIGQLRVELEDKVNQLQRYELSDQTMSDRIQELESKLRQTEMQLDQIRSSKQHDDYEACAKIAELDSERMRLDKALKDHILRLKEVSGTNSMLEKSGHELKMIINRQEEIIKRSRDEKLVNEASAERTLCEMKQELKELQAKLSASSASHEERLRQEISQAERQLSSADQREQKLMSDMQQLREGLATLLPDIKMADLHVRGDKWVQHYLAAVKQLAMTVEQLRERNNNNNSDIIDSPSKRSVDKSTLTIPTNGSRVGSPHSMNGRASKVGSHTEHDGDRKVMETKLLEMSDYIAMLEGEIRKLDEEKRGSTLSLASSDKSAVYMEEIKKLKLQRSKLEAQIKFGIDSLRAEQERVRTLEAELSKRGGEGVEQSTH